MPATPYPKNRTGHRGYTIQFMAVEHITKIFASGFGAKQLAERGAPKQFYWPEFGDVNGAKNLIDAVLDRNLAKMQEAKSRYPEYDLGLDEYIDQVSSQTVGTVNVSVQVLKTVTYDKSGVVMDIALEENRASKVRQLVATFRRGPKTLARKILATKRPTI